MADAVTKAQVLIVDDEQDHAQVMCEALQRQGHRCDVTYNLAEAEAKLDKKNYDVVVTDLMMEGKREGLEVLQQARSADAAAAGDSGFGSRGYSDCSAGDE